MKRAQPALPIYRYSKVLVATLAASFAAAWLLVVLVTRLPGVATFADKLAVSLFLGVLAVVLWLDFWGYATLRGLIAWPSAQGWKWAGVIGLLILFPVVVGVYLVRAVLDTLRAGTTGTRVATPPTRFRTTPIGLATLAGVTLLALVITTVGAAAMTGVASAQGSSTNGGQGNVSSSGHAIATSGANQGKGNKGHGHHHHK
jgi:hypothetical protein